ncbi:hypothetical protein EVAR_54604_1 [Eumeta japonica]|uniref:Uncharacterized protein n=1 Tax=Eumeta variegata TaxID=151549 RepID=A0A4C1YNQ8_EUMVA|nr:hypothetical protein EVAR_54604_1 [Eumeta japonica]
MVTTAHSNSRGVNNALAASRVEIEYLMKGKMGGERSGVIFPVGVENWSFCTLGALKHEWRFGRRTVINLGSWGAVSVTSRAIADSFARCARLERSLYVVLY